MKSLIKFELIKLTRNDRQSILTVLGDGNIEKVKISDNEIINSYFANEYVGYGAYRHATGIIAYCFIKNPKTKPETLTVVLSEYRNKGVASELRNKAIQQREFIGNVIYSACEHTNLASFKSLIKSGFQVFDVTKDGNVQFIKILRYD